MKKILQYGEGNFLRCFVQYKMQENKNAGGNGNFAQIVTPINTQITDLFKKQNNKYHTVLRGKMNGSIIDEIKVIDVISSVVNPYCDFESYRALYMDEDLALIISNTTEAGIVYNENDSFAEKLNVSFPAKVTQMLFERFEKFGESSAVTFLCVELIENNATELKRCVENYANLWDLGEEFKAFIEKNNFYNTLVDRIVTGHPKDMSEFEEKLGEKDDLLVVGEPYFLWVIEGDKKLTDDFAFLCDDHIIFTQDATPYRERKVKILNGSHTMLSGISLLAGEEFVGGAMKNKKIRKFLESVIENEISPTIDLEKSELNAFTASIFERFENPFVNHSFWAISLNGISKWKTRNLCSFVDYYNKFDKIPKGMAYGLSALIVFYITNLEKITDDKSVLDFFASVKGNDIETVCKKTLENEEFYGCDMQKFQGLLDYVTKTVKNILEVGIEGTIGSYENY